MTFQLRAGVSFCETGGKILFLDLARDRYFGLGADAERSFRRLAAGEPIGAADRPLLEGMAAAGLLIPSSDDLRPQPCATPPMPERSLLDDGTIPSPAAVASALARLAASALALKTRPLSLVLARLERRKALPMPPLDDEAVMLDVAAAFRRSMLVFSPLDQCLPRSLAAAHRLLDRGVGADLVLGVRLKPFAAHCWVQRGPVLVNETIDQVRSFTPILSI